MAEADTGAQPVFVDVSNAPEQFTLFTQVLHAKEANVEKNEEKNETAAKEQQKEVSERTTKPTEQRSKPVKVTTLSGERFKCTECNRYSAETEEQVQRHIRKMHRGQNPFQCYMCDYSTYNKPLFEEHVRIHRGIKPFKCPHCPYRSASKKNAKKHEQIHRPDNPLKCPSCPFIGRHVRSFNHHKLQHNKASAEELYAKLEEQQAARQSAEFVCEHCGTDFAVARNLASHQRNVKKCDECDAVLCSKYLYRRHMATVHSRDEDDTATFRCAVCPWRSSHQARVLLHLVHHPAQPLDASVDVSVLRACGVLP